ncbi:hypothetical protein E2C01_009510 [Portunus trituberculatus]|uniref:Uncharacterized protein n=1 Tax=Portunus trituberculatus TaxID=210409 RepID=A0A5B7D5Z5_PORTR|nr:hypothetical protein [Portunus trituberculatus]
MHTFYCYNLFTRAVLDVLCPMWKTKLFNVPQTLTFHDLGVAWDLCSCGPVSISTLIQFFF